MADPMKFHPAEFIAEELTARGWTVASLVVMSGIGLPMWEPVMSKRDGIRKSHALGLAKAFGTSMEFWLNLQKQFDDAEALRG